MLIIHIGTQKTGTSALQNYLHHNGSELLKQGIKYLEAGRDNNRRSSHGQLAQSIIGGSHSAAWQELRDELAVSSYRVDIMSAEGFWFCDPAAIRSEIPETVDLQVVVYLRRQDQYLQSLWKQAVVGGRKHDFWTWRKRVPERGNYLPIIEKWASQFSPDRLIIRPYESEKSGGNTISDFCQLIGAVNTASQRDVKRNPSPRLELLQFIRALNQLDLEMDRHQFFHALIGKSQKYIRTLDVLSNEETRSLMDEYAHENEILIEKYYRDSNYPLFPELGKLENHSMLDLRSDDFFKMMVDVFDTVIEFAAAQKIEKKSAKKLDKDNVAKRMASKDEKRKIARESRKAARKSARAAPTHAD